MTVPNLIFFALRTYLFDFRGSLSQYDESSGEYKSKAIKCVMKCIPKTGTLGNLDVATGMGTSGEFEVVYIKLSIDNKEQFEIDKFASISRFGGDDALSKVRQDLGME